MSTLDLIAFTVFLLCWWGYTHFSRKSAKKVPCIARCLHQHRVHWMQQLLKHEVRVADASILANLERNIAFFASSTLLVLAGIFTLFAQVEKLQAVIISFGWTQQTSTFAIELKLFVLTLIFALAFFQFTWSMRQYNFVNVMIGATPTTINDDHSGQLKEYAVQMATMQDQAGHAYNYGLRSYYFALAAIFWFFHSLIFIGASLLVVYILYRREFKSKAVRAIANGQRLLDEIAASKQPNT